MRVPPALLVLTFLTLAGCLGPAASPVEPDAHGVIPQAGSRAAATSTPITFSTPVHLGDALLGAEPSVAVAPNGTTYVGSPGEALYRSYDNATTWTGVGKTYCLDVISVSPGSTAGSVCPIKSTDPGKDGGGDTSLVVGPDGTLYHLGLSGKAGAIPFQFSRDGGATFSRAIDLAFNHSTDRQWIMMTTAGVLHASWRDLTYAKVVERASSDGGLTWTPLRNATSDGHEGPIASGPGVLYLPHVTNSAVYLAVSFDEGAHWTERKVANIRADTYDFPIAAVDAAGTVYVTWNHDPKQLIQTGLSPVDRPVATPRVFLASSNDQGLSWTTPAPVSPAGVPAMFPWMAAGSAGRVVLTWYEGVAPVPSDRVPNAWHVAVAISLDANTTAPTFTETFVSDTINHIGGICTEGLLCNLSGADRSMLDFYEVRILPDGSPVLAFSGDSTAYQAFTAIYATRMTAGPSLYG